MTFFYTNHKNNIRTQTEDILLFSSCVKKEVLQVHGENDLIILKCDRPDLVLAVLLACQETTDHILISNTDRHDQKFLAQFEKIQTIETHLLVECFNRFQSNNNKTLIIENENDLRRKICESNHSKIWFKSSGSSGSAKYIQHNFQNFIISTNLTLKSYLHIVPQINWALTLSINHIGGFMSLFRSFYLGHNVQHFFWKNPSEKDQSNVFSFVPTQVHWILERPASPIANLLKKADLVIISGGEISNSLIKKIKSFKSHGHVVFTYGATETCSQVAVGFFKDEIEKIEYRPFDSVEIKNFEKRAVIKSPTNYRQIWEQGQLQKETGNHQITINDELIIDPKSHRFTFKGRSDEIIVSGGENISLNKVKKAIQKIYANESIIILGAPDEKWGEVLICFSQNKINHLEAKQPLLETLSNFEIPKYFYSLSNINYEGVKPSRNDLINHHKINKFPWIAFHGFMGCPDDWSELQNYGLENIIRINLNDFLEAKSWKDTAERLLSFLKDTLKSHDKLNLIGYSMGARVLLSIVRPLRDRINKVVLISSQFGDLLGSHQKLERKTKDENLFSSVTNHKEWDDFISNWYENNLFKGIKEHSNYSSLIKRRNFKNIEFYRKQLHIWSVATMPNYLITYPKELNQSTILICGENDEKYSTYTKEIALKNNFPFKIIKGHSHALLTCANKEIYKYLISLI